MRGGTCVVSVCMARLAVSEGGTCVVPVCMARLAVSEGGDVCCICPDHELCCLCTGIDDGLDVMT